MFQFIYILANILSSVVDDDEDDDNCQTSGYEVVSHYVLICISLMTNGIEHFFHVFILFGEMFIQILCHF